MSHHPFVLMAATGKQHSSSSYWWYSVAFPEPALSALAVAGTTWGNKEACMKIWQVLEAVPGISGGSRALWGQPHVYEPQRTPVLCLSRRLSNMLKSKL